MGVRNMVDVKTTQGTLEDSGERHEGHGKPLGKLFATGKLAMTAAVHEWANTMERTAALTRCLKRHSDGDWGTVDEEDWRCNDLALIEGDERLLSAYLVDERKVWIITEGDHSVTTILFPSDY
jgi:hypothetical protein